MYFKKIWHGWFKDFYSKQRNFYTRVIMYACLNKLCFSTSSEICGQKKSVFAKSKNCCYVTIV